MKEAHLDTLLTLLVVSRTGSFAAAARELDTTRARISRQIAATERQLNIRLCHRSTRQVVLTDAAQALVRDLERPLAEVSAALAALSEGEGELQGLVRLSVSHAFGRRYIAPLVARFMAQHPRVRIQLHLRDSIESLVGQAIDLAIRIGELPQSEMIARSLGDIQVALVGAPGLLQGGEPHSLADLPRFPAIAYRPLTLREPRTWHFRVQGQQQVYKLVDYQIEVDSLEGAADLARAGIGLAMLPLHLVEGDLASGRLRRVLPGYSCLGPPIHLCYARRDLVPARVRALIDFLLAELGGRLL